MEIALPAAAIRPVLYLDDQAGRDQVAQMAKADWTAFERPLPEIFFACVRHFAGLIVDVGANTGYYALLAALARADARVLAFEPDPTVLALLVANVRLNKLRRSVEISKMALSERCGTASLFVPTQEHGLVETSSSLEATFKPAHSDVISITATTLDAFLGRWRYRLSRVGVMKIDVEGHESAVLRGAAATIRRWRPIVFIEILPGADTVFLSRFITENDYADFPLELNRLAEARCVNALPDAWNHALVPAEKVGGFRDAAAGFSRSRSQPSCH